MFRYHPRHLTETQQRDRVNRQVHQSLLESGQAVMAKTQIAGEVYLKLTLLNPRTTNTHITELLQQIKFIANHECTSNQTPTKDNKTNC